MDWRWPQYVMAALYGTALLGAGLIHNDPKTGRYNAPSSWLTITATIYVLHCGGFW
jgi:hypothetical protein